MTAARIRVVHIASGREWRGGQRQVALLAKELDRLGGVEQLVITSAGSELARALGGDGVATRTVDWRHGLSWGAFRAALAEGGTGRVVFHAHTGHAVTIAAVAALLGECPFVATRRTAFPLRFPLFWRQAAKVIAVSAAVERILIASRLDSSRVVVIHSGIDISHIRTTVTGNVRRDLGLPETGPIVVALAALTPEKGHQLMLQAAAHHRASGLEIHWVFAGAGRLEPHLRAVARDLNVTGLVHFVGHLADPLPLASAASVFVSASTQEGLGTGILEALALGVPVVATAVGGVPEVLEGGAGLLVQPGDPAALAEAVSSLVLSQELRHRTAEAGSRAVNRFEIRGMAERVARLYGSVLADY